MTVRVPISCSNILGLNLMYVKLLRKINLKTHFLNVHFPLVCDPSL